MAGIKRYPRVWFIVCAAVLSACCTMAAHEWIKRTPPPPVLPWTGWTIYLNSIMGLPDPSDGDPYYDFRQFKGDPRFDAFCHVAAETARPFIQDFSLPYEAWMIPFRKYEVRGWPFVSLQVCTDVVINPPPSPMARRWNQHTIRIAEDGSSPVSWSGLIGNWAVFLIPCFGFVWLVRQVWRELRNAQRISYRLLFVVAAMLSACATWGADAWIVRSPPSLPSWAGESFHLNEVMGLPSRRNPVLTISPQRYAGNRRFNTLCKTATEIAQPYIGDANRYDVTLSNADHEHVTGWPFVSSTVRWLVTVNEYRYHGDDNPWPYWYHIPIAEDGSSPLSWIGLIGNWCFFLIPCFLLTWLVSRAILAFWRRLTRERHGFPVIIASGEQET